MKNTVNLLILILSSQTFALAQDLKHVTTRINGLKESYFVYKTDKSIKEGVYTLVYDKDTLIKGCYKSNKAVGVWNIKANKKELELSYDYDSSLVKYYKFPGDEKTVYDNINRPPICMIGFNNLKLITVLKSKYPKDFEPIGPLQIKTKVGFTIDSKGIPSNFHILESSSMIEFDKQAYDQVKEAVENEKWLPALDKTNNPVPYDLEIVLGFMIQ